MTTPLELPVISAISYNKWKVLEIVLSLVMLAAVTGHFTVLSPELKRDGLMTCREDRRLEVDGRFEEESRDDRRQVL